MAKKIRRLQAIPEPSINVDSLRSTALATKEVVETMAGHRGDPLDYAVTWYDLVNLGLVKPDQVPKE